MIPTLHETALALGGAAPQNGEPNPLANLVLMVVIFSIFYLVLILPMRTKQRKLDELIKGLKTGDKVVVSPGILGTIVSVEEDSFQVRVDDKTKLRVLKSAIAGLQGQPQTLEKA
jgi:preprotein translocase subunit YajC